MASILETKNNPEFIKLEGECNLLMTRLSEILKEVDQKWPLQNGFKWCGVINGKFKLFLNHLDSTT